MQKVKFIKYLLFPFAIIYGLVTYIRNILFDYGMGKFKSQSFSIPIISVGNITVGGTGKTPHTEWIIRLLQDKYNVAVLSRGYKRKTKGLLIADSYVTAADIGDEPMQMFNKFPKIQVLVSEKRVLGVNAVETLLPKSDLIIMDDAFQHRYVKPGFSVLIMDYNRPFWKDCILPVGELREYTVGKKRADIIIVSKCPATISKRDHDLYIHKLALNEKQDVFFTAVSYKNIYPVFEEMQQGVLDIENKNVLLVSGIAQPKLMFDYVTNRVKSVTLLQYGDHHNFSSNDINDIEAKLKGLGDDAIIITTEKDAVRFKYLIDSESHLAKKIYSLPIEIQVLDNKESQLEDKIFSYVRKN